jgi:hypothetical protein
LEPNKNKISPEPLLGLWFILIFSLLTVSCTRRSDLRLNQIQIVGTYNSYHLRPSKEVLESQRGASLDYGHAPIRTQLDAGVRSFAIDIYKTNDAFRVLHIPGMDEGSNCETLKECLGEIIAWSNQYPEHIPLIVFIEVKNLKKPTGDLIPMNNAGMDKLESLLWMKIGKDNLLTSDEVRGTESSLEEAVLTEGWPLLDSVRGKIMIVLNAPQPLQSYYSTVSPSLSGRAMFVKVEPGNPEAAVVVSNDTTNRDAAFASGSHIITTDFPSPTPHPRTGYLVALPQGKAWRQNPVSGPNTEN